MQEKVLLLKEEEREIWASFTTAVHPVSARMRRKIEDRKENSAITVLVLITG